MSTMTEDTTYNGWKNYPTWSIHLWLTNDEPLYRETLELVEETRTNAYVIDARNVRAEPLPDRVAVADALKGWVREMIEPDDASMASDLLGYALDTVDWFELADAFLED